MLVRESMRRRQLIVAAQLAELGRVRKGQWRGPTVLGDHSASRSRCPLLRFVRVVAIASLGLTALSGCGGGRFDEGLEFGVRTDLIVSPVPNTFDSQPTGFFHPGILPLMRSRANTLTRTFPPTCRSSRARSAKSFSTRPNSALHVRADYAKNLQEMFGKPAHPKLGGMEPAALKAADDSMTADEIIKVLHQDEKTLEEGSRLYRLANAFTATAWRVMAAGRRATGSTRRRGLPPGDLQVHFLSTRSERPRYLRRDDLLHTHLLGHRGYIDAVVRAVGTH